MTALRVGVAGLGNVGAEFVRLLINQKDLLSRRCGRQIEVTAVSARNKGFDRGIDLSNIIWFDDPNEMALSKNLDVICELIGGDTGPALQLTETALKAGKHVVTANKAMLAIHGCKLTMLAESSGSELRYEAAVAGGIPIIKSMREGLAGNNISAVFGILNGTCNYILTRMHDSIAAGEKTEFSQILREAQELGYAESDPSTDIDGIDAAHKIALLSSLAFGIPVDFNSVYIEGIRHISALDIAYALELGYRVKLLAIAKDTQAGIEQRVHPCMVPVNTPIANVNGVNNAIVVNADFLGTAVFEGPGAGGGATASAVAGDVLDLARGQKLATFGIPFKALSSRKYAPIQNIISPYYLRLMLLDQPGVIADIAACLRDQSVSVESMIQRARSPGEAVPVVLTTHEAEEGAVRLAISTIDQLPGVLETPRMIRIEDI